MLWFSPSLSPPHSLIYLHTLLWPGLHQSATVGRKQEPLIQFSPLACSTLVVVRRKQKPLVPFSPSVCSTLVFSSPPPEKVCKLRTGGQIGSQGICFVLSLFSAFLVSTILHLFLYTHFTCSVSHPLFLLTHSHTSLHALLCPYLSVHLSPSSYTSLQAHKVHISIPGRKNGGKSIAPKKTLSAKNQANLKK